MAIYMLRVAKRDTGEDSLVEVNDAASREDAINHAATDGYLVAAIEEVYDFYQDPGDPPYVRRIDEPWPEGIGASLIKKVGPQRMGIPIAGITKESSRMEHLMALMQCRVRRLNLLREPDNRYDRNAIKVFGRWWNEQGHDVVGELGFIGKEIAKEIAVAYPTGPIGARITALLLPRPGYTPGIRIEPGRPARRSGRAGSSAESNEAAKGNQP